MSADTGDLSDGSRMRSFWKHLWRCNVPHKVRHFVWRACRDILPTKANLVARKVIPDSCCEESDSDKRSDGLVCPPSSVAALVYCSLATSHTFRSMDSSFVGRKGNRPAHLLARHALGIANFSVWVEDISCFIEQALAQDVYDAFQV